MRDCPKWPTMQWLPHEVVDILDARISTLADGGFSTSRAEIICALILRCDPSDLGFLKELWDYKSYYRPVRPSRVRLRGVPVIIRMPSPITLRLDGLVRSVAERSQRTYRYELIGTLLLYMENEADQLEEKCLDYRQAAAGEAAVPGQPKSWVLRQRRPQPGARSLLETKKI